VLNLLRTAICLIVCLKTCRMPLASVSRELRKWSIEDGDDMWECMELDLTSGHCTNPATWAGGGWAQKFSDHVRELQLFVAHVSALLRVASRASVSDRTSAFAQLVLSWQYYPTCYQT